MNKDRVPARPVDHTNELCVKGHPPVCLSSQQVDEVLRAWDSYRYAPSYETDI